MSGQENRINPSMTSTPIKMTESTSSYSSNISNSNMPSPTVNKLAGK